MVSVEIIWNYTEFDAIQGLGAALKLRDGFAQ